jgi:magnesium transporter
MITVRHNTKRSSVLQTLENYKVGSWIHVERPTDNELSELADRFDLDDGLLHDATDPYEVPRVELDEGKTYVFTRVPYRAQNSVFTSPVLVIISPSYLITVTQRSLPLFDRFIDQKVDFYTTQRANFFFHIFIEITVLYNRFMTQIRKEVQESMAELDNISNTEIVKFVRFESTLNNFLSSLLPTNEALKKISSGKYLKLYEEDKELVEDVFLSNEQLIESCRTNLKAISNIRNAYSTIMTNNLNQVIKLLTALTIVLTVPTMIASFFGMNVGLPGEGSPTAFIWIVGVSLVMSLLILALFYYKNWLK